MVRKPGMGLFRNSKQTPGETNQPTPPPTGRDEQL
jgi:hypothetical protein